MLTHKYTFISVRRALLFLFLIANHLLSSQTETMYFKDWTHLNGTISENNQNTLLDNTVSLTDDYNNIYIASSNLNPQTGVHDLLITKMNTEGEELWNFNFSLPNYGDIIVGDMILMNGGAIMFTGSISNSPINYDVLTLKLQNNGTIDWHQLFGGNAGLYDGGTKIAKEGNNLYVSGITTGSFTQNNLDALILAYDLGGNLQWSNSYDASGFKDIGAGLVVSDEKIGLISGSEDSSNSYRIVLLEYDSSGTLLEENNITSSNIIIDELIDYSVDNNGNFYILGSKFDTSTAFDFLIIKMNPDFSIAWESSLSSEGQANDKASALAIDDSGYVYVSGSTIREQTSSFLIGKYSPTGNLEWSKTYDETTTSHEKTKDITINSSGDIFVSGQTDANGSKDILTLAYDASGNLNWSEKYNSEFNKIDKIHSISSDENNNVIVIGKSATVEAGQVIVKNVSLKYSKKDLILPLDDEPLSKAISFIKNNGQLTDSDSRPVNEVLYYTNNHPQLFVQKDKISLVITSFASDSIQMDTTHRVDLAINGIREQNIIPREKQSDYRNYYDTHIPRGREKVNQFRELIYANYQNNIDLHLSSNSRGSKYEFVVYPSGSSNNIELKFEGQTGLSVNQNNELEIHTTIGNILLPEPKAYKLIDNEEIETSWTPIYQVNGNSTTINVEGSTDPIIIRISKDSTVEECDPVDNEGIEYSTYYGGFKNDMAYDMSPGIPSFGVTDVVGTLYITGVTNSDDFPILGQAVTSIQDTDAFILCMKGFQRLWSLYYGGIGGDTQGNAISVDLGNKLIWMGGRTGSPNLPVTSENDFPHDDFIGTPPTSGRKGFLAKFNEDGFLNYSTYFGGILSSIEVSSNGNIFFGGWGGEAGLATNELEDNGGVFYQDPENNGTSFITEFDKLGQMIWSTEFGQNNSHLVDLKINSEGDLLITGRIDPIAGEPDPPFALDFVEQSGINDLFITESGSIDGYVGKFNIDSGERELIWSTLIPFSVPYEIDADTKDNIVLIGFKVHYSELHPDIPTLNSQAGCGDIFMIKFDKDGVVDKARYFGGSGNEGSDFNFCNLNGFGSFGGTHQTASIEIDNDDNIYITSNTRSSDFPTLFNENTYNQDLLGNSDYDQGDAIIAAFTEDLEVYWSTFFGGRSTTSTFSDAASKEHGTGLVIDGNLLYATGLTSSDCEKKIPLVDNSESNYYTEDLDLDGIDEPSTRPDLYLTVLRLPTKGGTTSYEEQEQKDARFILSPNPANGYLNIDFSSELKASSTVKVSSILGEIIFEKNMFINEQNLSIETKNLASGIYLFTLIQDGVQFSKKFVVTH